MEQEEEVGLVNASPPFTTIRSQNTHPRQGQEISTHTYAMTSTTPLPL